MEENELVELLLQSLLDSYDQLVINITNNNIADHLAFDDVVGAILEEEFSIRITTIDWRTQNK